MNIVLLELNSYEQTLRLFINGTQPSVYSELSNFTFQQALKAPGDVLDAIGREVNDDFDLHVTANRFEYYLIAKAAESNEYCNSCQFKWAKVAASTHARVERLAEYMKPKQFAVCVRCSGGLPEPVVYGNISVSFTADPTAKADIIIDVPTPELAVSAVETLLVNPLIGQAVASVANCTIGIAICSRLNPILSVNVPQHMEAGQRYEVTITSFPADDNMPKCVVKSADPDVVLVEGVELAAHGAGSATIQVFVCGENQPFFISNIDVKKTVLASRLEIVGLDEALHEGDTIPLSVNIFPADAEDANNVTFETSDSNVAEIENGKLILTGSGQCEIVARATHASVKKKIIVSAALARLKISQNVFNLNVGNQVPVAVEVFPKDAHNSKYRWQSSDKTVAVVVKEDGQEYIKSVGIGTCELTCKNIDGTASDTCTVNVKSIMYKNEKKGSKLFPVLVIIALVTLVCSLLSNQPPAKAGASSGQIDGVSEPIATVKDGSVSAEDLPLDMVWGLANQYAAEEQAKNDAEGVQSFSYSDVKVYAIYFTETDYDYGPNEYSLHIVITYDFFVGGEYNFTYYMPMVFENIQFDSNGEINISYEDGSESPFFYTEADEYLEILESKYVVSKIG